MDAGPDIFSKLKKEKYDILFLGKEYVGKTSILKRVLMNEFSPKYTPTVEETHSEEFVVNGQKILVDMIDTSGAYSFPAMRRLRMRKSDAFVLVFAVDDEASLRAVDDLLDELRQVGEEDGVEEPKPVVVVANKIDLDPVDHKVDLAAMEMKCRFSWGCRMTQVSAVKDENLISIFNDLLAMSDVDITVPDEIRRQSSCFKLSEEQILTVKREEETRKKEKRRRRISKIPIIRHFSHDPRASPDPFSAFHHGGDVHSSCEKLVASSLTGFLAADSGIPTPGSTPESTPPPSRSAPHSPPPPGANRRELAATKLASSDFPSHDSTLAKPTRDPSTPPAFRSGRLAELRRGSMPAGAFPSTVSLPAVGEKNKKKKKNKRPVDCKVS